MIAGASKRGLLLRVGKGRECEALSRSGARPMEMRGRRMEGHIYIDPPALNDYAVGSWLRLAIPYVQTLPFKPPAAKPDGRRRGKNSVIPTVAQAVPQRALKTAHQRKATWLD